jgi:anti-anti-sigma factor
MTIEIIQSEKKLLKLAFEGKLDANSVAHNSAKFFELLRNRKGPVFVDFSEVTYLSSLGIRMLLTASKDVKDQGHEFKIENPTPEIEKIFMTAGLTDLLK